MADTDYSAKEFKTIIKDLLDQFKKTGDKQLLPYITAMRQAERRGQMGPEAKAQTASVRSHIERRAELQAKTSMRMPNIASILTGGAQSPISGLNQMQKQASKPFKGVWDYKKAESRMHELGRIKKDKRTDEQQGELERLGAEQPGKKRRAESGFGKNLMGKNMQGLIGKAGKFMESSKGQGMMAGGMMGASILTMIIKKAMEASPMLQQMLKIMNVAMTLFLRPIGDFIGGMLKPIMLFFLREVAIPMLAKGKGMIKMGEQFGRGALGFLLKPVETIQAALNPLITNFDGIKEWMTEQKLRGLAAEMDGKEMLTVLNIIKNKDNMDVTKGADPRTGAAGYTTTYGQDYADLQNNFGGFLTQFEEIMTQGMARGGTVTYEYAGGYGQGNKGNTDILSGMGITSDSFTVLGTAADTVAGTFTKLNTVLEDMLPGQTPGATAENPIPTTTGSVQGPPELAPEVIAHWSDISVYDTLQKMYAAANDQIRKGMQAEAGSAQHSQAMKEYTELTGSASGPGSISVLDGMKRKFKGMQEAMDRLPKIIEVELENREEYLSMVKEATKINSLVLHQEQMKADILESANKTNEDSTKKSVAYHLSIAQILGDGWVAVSALLAQIAAVRSHRAYASSGGGGGGAGKISGGYGQGMGYSYTHQGATFNVDTTASWGFQHGGMINEPIFGIGKSGQQYTFGEAGREKVTPMFGDKAKDGGSIGPVNINVNIDSVKNDVDLEKIKPIVERALQEVHARRGII